MDGPGAIDKRRRGRHCFPMTGRRQTEPPRRRILAGGMAALALGLLVLVSGPAVRGADPPVRFDSSEVTVVTNRGRFVFSVEMAVTPEQRVQGLQNRRKLPLAAGMLFDFKNRAPVSMWMKNTYVSLDMVFIDEDGSVVRIAPNTRPLSLATIGSGGPVRAVLELNAGTTERLGLRPGDKVEHPLFGGGG